jgi:hypothetical protein
MLEVSTRVLQMVVKSSRQTVEAWYLQDNDQRTGLIFPRTNSPFSADININNMSLGVVYHVKSPSKYV